MNELQALETLFAGKNVNITIADLVALLSGNPISIQVDPFNQSVAGKTLTVSLVANAVQIQLH